MGEKMSEENDNSSCGCSCIGCLIQILGILGLIYLWSHRSQVWQLVTGG